MQNESTLSASLRSQGWGVDQLTGDDRCEWVRCWFGILGLIRVPDQTTDSKVSDTLSSLIVHAHSMLDQVPEEALEFEELWNVTLLVHVPWPWHEMEGRPNVAIALADVVGNTTGSRKLIVWKGEQVLDHVGKLGASGGTWQPTSGDPIREALLASARDEREAAAINMLLDGGRIGDAKLDDMVHVFGADIKKRGDDK